MNWLLSNWKIFLPVIAVSVLLSAVFIQTSRLNTALTRADKAEQELADSEAYTLNLIQTIDLNQARQKELTTMANNLKKEIADVPESTVECFAVSRALDGLRNHQNAGKAHP